jgi:hypothetical protein
MPIKIIKRIGSVRDHIKDIGEGRGQTQVDNQGWGNKKRREKRGKTKNKEKTRKSITTQIHLSKSETELHLRVGKKTVIKIHDLEKRSSCEKLLRVNSMKEKLQRWINLVASLKLSVCKMTWKDSYMLVKWDKLLFLRLSILLMKRIEFGLKLLELCKIESDSLWKELTKKQAALKTKSSQNLKHKNTQANFPTNNLDNWRALRYKAKMIHSNKPTTHLMDKCGSWVGWVTWGE